MLFDSTRLQEIADAFERRSKAIRYHSASFSINRETKESLERMVVEFIGVCELRVCLSIWEDDVFWLGVSISGASRKGGYKHYEELHGTLNKISTFDVVERFEKTLLSHKEARTIWPQ